MSLQLKHARMAALLLVFATTGARAGSADVLSGLVGYTIIASKTIDSFYERGEGRKDGFEGCTYDRVIIFTDGTAVTCRTYSYRPMAVIWANR